MDGLAHDNSLFEQTGSSTPVVVVLNDFCYVQGGASKIAIDEAVALAAAGIRVIFLGAVGPVCDRLANAPLETICLDQPELLQVVRNPSVILQGLWNGQAARRMANLLQTLDRRTTVVHLHGYTKSLTTGPVRVARDLDFQVVCTLHDFYAACPNGAFFDYRRQAPCAKAALSLDCIATHCDKRRYIHKLFRVVRAFAQQRLGRFPHSIRDYITLSGRSAAILRPYLPPGARLYPLENIIDVRQTAPVDVARNRTIVFLGRLDIEKGVRLLAEAAVNCGLPITYIGDGPLRAEIEATQGATVTGWIPFSEVLSLLSDARCVVFPSQWYETYGLAASEAQARGIPVIVSDISAAAERITEQVTGWHFRSSDSADLERCLSVVQDDETVRAAGKAAYEAFWAAPPNEERHVGGLMAIYASMLNS